MATATLETFEVRPEEVPALRYALLEALEALVAEAGGPISDATLAVSPQRLQAAGEPVRELIALAAAVGEIGWDFLAPAERGVQVSAHAEVAARAITYACRTSRGGIEGAIYHHEPDWHKPIYDAVIALGQRLNLDDGGVI